MSYINVKNDLTKKQKDQLSNNLEKLMSKYSKMAGRQMNGYFSGVVDGLNHAYKLVNEIEDDYSISE